jgi:hypothetical protein
MVWLLSPISKTEASHERGKIVAIADEVLKGMVINSNNSHISAALAKIGLRVSRHEFCLMSMMC